MPSAIAAASRLPIIVFVSLVFIIVISFFLVFIVSVGSFFSFCYSYRRRELPPLRVTAFLQTVLKVLRMDAEFF